jgi:hypothetical protein
VKAIGNRRRMFRSLNRTHTGLPVMNQSEVWEEDCSIEQESTCVPAGKAGVKMGDQQQSERTSL